MNFSVNLIGAGNMGGALLRGWLANGLAPDHVTVFDPAPSDDMLELFKELGVRHEPQASGGTQCDVLMLAVKPQKMAAVLPGVVAMTGPQTVVVSVAAGTTVATMSEILGEVPIVRVMPNTPSLVGRGMSAGFATPAVSETQKDRVQGLMQAVGRFEWVANETLIDAVTAVSGSGPAYVFHLAECMALAGIKAGLPEDLAMTLARETVSGAGELLRQSRDEPAILRENVTSPGGTTAAALSVLMREGGMAMLLEEAVLAAQKRSVELAENAT